MIEVDVQRRLGDFELQVAFEAKAEGITALFGQSGAGKTTLVNLLAGLARPDRGRISVQGHVLFDSQSGVNVAPEKRRLGYVFQEDRLFPHLNVRANLEYGLRRIAADQRRIALPPVVEALDIEGLLERRTQTLSGGEKQRVSIGRALLASPHLLLMDEPLASLDTARKNEILPFIERLRDEFRIPIVYVSHSADEIVRLADTLVLLSRGRIAAVGPVEALMSRLDLRPLTGRYEAGAVIPGQVAGTDPEFGLAMLSFEGGTLTVPLADLEIGARIRVRIRARDVTLARKRPEDISTLNVFHGKIAEILGGGSGDALVDVRVDIGAPLWARITRRSLHDLSLGIGDEVYALIKGVAIDHGSVGLRGHAPRGS